MYIYNKSLKESKSKYGTLRFFILTNRNVTNFKNTLSVVFSLASIFSCFLNSSGFQKIEIRNSFWDWDEHLGIDFDETGTPNLLLNRTTVFFMRPPVLPRGGSGGNNRTRALAQVRSLPADPSMYASLHIYVYIIYTYKYNLHTYISLYAATTSSLLLGWLLASGAKPLR
jgi:hypothetical protein